jgi:hypothetical protein
MSNIQEKIKKLEDIQKKVDILRDVRDFPRKLKGFDTELLTEVVDLIEKTLDPIIEQLESGSDEIVLAGINSALDARFSDSDVVVLKQLISKVNNKPANTPKDSQILAKREQAQWALEHSDLNGRPLKVQYLSSEKDAKVIRFEHPYIVVKFEGEDRLHKTTRDKIRISEEA